MYYCELFNTNDKGWWPAASKIAQLDHRITNEDTKQTIIRDIIEESLLKVARGRNSNGLAIPPGGWVRLHVM